MKAAEFIEEERHHHCHLAIKIAKLVLQAATLATAICAVHELDRIHHRLKKIEKHDKHHLL